MKKVKFLFVLIFCLYKTYVYGQNPIVQTMYTADPAPLVYNGKLFLYTSHDEDNSTWFVMDDWKVYSTDDMVNWTDHGVIASYKTFDWAKGDAWAIQCVERNGKFYLYAPITSKENNRPAIGVAVSDSPYGPFYDLLGKPLVQTNYGDIDPSVMIDDDGQAYLYWGNPVLYYAKLKEDMISLDGDVVKVPMVEESFGKRSGNKERPTLYEEAPWLYKRKNLYYLLWAGGPIPEHIGYSTSTSPLGPWKYQGVLMPTEGRSFTNHPAIIDYKDKTYFFYHNGALPGGSGFTRSVAVEEVTFKKNGAIAPLKMTGGIRHSLKPVYPFQKIEAETMAWSEHVKASQNSEVGVFITAKKNGAYTMVKDVNFGTTAASKLVARVGTTHNQDISLEVRLDSLNGQSLGSVKVPRTGGNNRWALVDLQLPEVKGVHNLYFVFHGKAETDILFFDYWKLEK